MIWCLHGGFDFGFDEAYLYLLYLFVELAKSFRELIVMIMESLLSWNVSEKLSKGLLGALSCKPKSDNFDASLLLLVQLVKFLNCN